MGWEDRTKNNLSRHFKEQFLAGGGARGGGGGGGYSYCHTYVGSDHVFGFEILNFNIFLGFQRNKYFFGV